MLRLWVLLVMLALLLVCSPQLFGQWKPAENPLFTPWAKDVKPESVLKEYPRPQMMRQQWSNLNGLWDYAITPKDQAQPKKWDGKILVPFCIESALSGVKKKVGHKNHLWYHRTISIPTNWKDQRILLHFGGVDWQTTVYINGKEVGQHQGCYDPFTFDITDQLKEGDNAGGNSLVVKVYDPTDKHFQPRGKQVSNPHGIWYTSVTGIWQTVWLEPVAKTHIHSFKVTPDIDQKTIRVSTKIAGENADQHTVRVIAERRGDSVQGKPGQELTLKIEEFELWSPDNPKLYDLTIEVSKDGEVVDYVKSYFAMRKIEMRKDTDGYNRLFLNNKPLFQFGPLDQGWWPDGLYTAPTDEALKYDIEMTKKLGFNMCRKHVKVEPARWYYWCDRLGLMVWQDMPSGDKYIGPKAPDYKRSPESEANFRREWQAIMQANHHFASIVIWVPFNEGWGQFKTTEILNWTKQLDPSRLVDGASGWSDRGSGDMHDLHQYPGPGMFPTEDNRASVLGEFGGLGWPVPDHLWWNKRNWGYRTYKTKEQLQHNYENVINGLIPLMTRGLAAAVYTQTTDVEGEVNGLMTYDRKLVKLDINRVSQLHKRLYEMHHEAKVIVPASDGKEGADWRYTLTQPQGNWWESHYDDKKWKQGKGGFGTTITPNTVTRTNWKTSTIWMRRQFTLTIAPEGITYLYIHHDEDATIYINGVKAAQLSGWTSNYTMVPISTEAAKVLKSGQNTIAIHCKQTDGGQYIDAGLMVIKKK